jgi:hypothetical protein
MLNMSRAQIRQRNNRKARCPAIAFGENQTAHRSTQPIHLASNLGYIQHQEVKAALIESSIRWALHLTWIAV